MRVALLTAKLYYYKRVQPILGKLEVWVDSSKLHYVRVLQQGFHHFCFYSILLTRKSWWSLIDSPWRTSHSNSGKVSMKLLFIVKNPVKRFYGILYRRGIFFFWTKPIVNRNYHTFRLSRTAESESLFLKCFNRLHNTNLNTWSPRNDSPYQYFQVSNLLYNIIMPYMHINN